jgi:hypothetical protein
VDGQPAQRSHRLFGGPASFQHVADHERDPEPLADLGPAAEGERDGQAGFVDPVQQAPQAVGHAEHPRTGERRPGHHRVEQPVIPVVVADQGRAARQDRRLRASGQEGRRVPQCEHGGRLGVLAEQARQPPPDRDEFGHVLVEPCPGLPGGGPGARAVPPPLPERRPGRGQVPAQLVFLDRPQGE